MTNTAIGITLAAISLAALAGMWWLAAKAPLGWQDETGFHLGEEPLDDPENWGSQ